ncbi:MAG: hypothetical protein GY765_22580 [bacterium]|nr:hypothetical protein [bacterium]
MKYRGFDIIIEASKLLPEYRIRVYDRETAIFDYCKIARDKEQAINSARKRIDLWYRAEDKNAGFDARTL